MTRIPGGTIRWFSAGETNSCDRVKCRTSSMELILDGSGRAGRPFRPGKPHVRQRLWIEYPIHNAT
eukprot:scaffold1313_cov349-Pavlova_lutheri.AAC.1